MCACACTYQEQSMYLRVFARFENQTCFSVCLYTSRTESVSACVCTCLGPVIFLLLSAFIEGCLSIFMCWPVLRAGRFCMCAELGMYLHLLVRVGGCA
jgi:hypothetical protein